MADDDSLKPAKGQPRVSRLWFSFVSSSLLETYNIPVVASSTATSGEEPLGVGVPPRVGGRPKPPFKSAATRFPVHTGSWAVLDLEESRTASLGAPAPRLPGRDVGDPGGDGSLSSRRRRGSRPGRAQGEHTAPAQPGQAEARAAASEPLLTRARQRPNSPLGQATRQHHDPRQLLGSPYLPL